MILSQPFPAPHPSASVLKYSFYSGVTVFTILILFLPFGFDQVQGNERYLHAFLFGLATFIVVTLNTFLLPTVFPSLFDERRWTVGKELIMMLWNIVSVTLANAALMHWLYGLSLSPDRIIRIFGITAAVGIFPVTLIVLLKQQALLKKYTGEAIALEKQLKELPVRDNEISDFIILQGDNQDENLSILLSDLRYISSADNYIRINYANNGIIVRKVMRSTLKKAEQMLSQYPAIFRCHRAYIINLAAVDSVSGNAQGYKLHINGSDELIPVSRSLNQQLFSVLQQYRNGSR
jgi:hypothetical protein